MWKIQMGENRSVHDSPMLQPDSGHQSYTLPIRSSECSEPIHSNSVRFSSKPVHHLISLALSNAWLATRCICEDFMNKSGNKL